MAEPPPKRLRVSADEFEGDDEASEVLSNDAESDISTQATFGSSESFEIVDLSSNGEEDYEYVESEQFESDIEFTNMSQWWAAGPPGDFQFLMLIEPQLVSELGNYGMTSTRPLPYGWEIDEGPLRELAEELELRD